MRKLTKEHLAKMIAGRQKLQVYGNFEYHGVWFRTVVPGQLAVSACGKAVGQHGMLAGRKHSSGYIWDMYRNAEGKARNMYRHRAVATAFLYNYDNLPCVNHINGDKTDNRTGNLEWCTPRQNTLHAMQLGLHRNCPRPGQQGFQRSVCVS